MVSEQDQHTFLDAAKAFDWDTVRARLKAEPSLVNVQPCGRWSVLHQAAQHGSVEAVLDLLRLDADPRVRNKSGQSPSEVASNECVRELIKKALEGGSATAEEPRTYDQRFAWTVAISPLIGDRHTPITVDAGTGRRVAEGLGAAHAQLEGQRILLVERGQEEEAKTIEKLGLAKDVTSGFLRTTGCREECVRVYTMESWVYKVTNQAMLKHDETMVTGGRVWSGQGASRYAVEFRLRPFACGERPPPPPPLGPPPPPPPRALYGAPGT